MKTFPKGFYFKAKAMATKYFLELHKKKKFPVTILRLYQAYGPKQDTNRLIPIVIKSCLKNKKFPCSTGIQYRDFLHIDDLINSVEETQIQSENDGLSKNSRERTPRVCMAQFDHWQP